MNRHSLKALSLLFLFVLLAAACTPAATTQPAATQPAATQEPAKPPEPTKAPEMVHLKISILPFLSYAPIFIAKEEGFYAEQGLDVEFVRIDKTSEAMPALASGEIDVASGFFDVSTLNAVAKGGDIRYVSDKGYLDPATCSGSTWVVRKELVENGTLDDLKNMKGMKIALTPASSAEYALDLLLKDVGLSHKDVEILNIPLAARLEGMGKGTVDMAGVSDPWTIRMVNAGYGLEWKPWNTYMPDFQFSINMYGPNLMRKNPEIGKRYMIAYLKGVRQYNQGKTPRNIEITAKYTEMKPEEVEQSCWMAMRSDGLIDPQIAGMSGFQEWALANGYITTVVPPENLLDLSFVQFANEALK